MGNTAMIEGALHRPKLQVVLSDSGRDLEGGQGGGECTYLNTGRTCGVETTFEAEAKFTPKTLPGNKEPSNPSKRVVPFAPEYHEPPQ